MSDDQAAVAGSAVDLPGGATSGVERHQDALVQPQGISGLSLIGGCGMGLDLLADAREF